MTAPATYLVHVTDIAEQDSLAAFNSLYSLDDAVVNAQATRFRAKVRGQVVWAIRLTQDAVPSLYVTHQQAASLGLCHCGKPATHAGFEGLRCDRHAKGGMSLLCATEGCWRVTHTGFSTWCNKCITPAQREAHEVRQAELRAQYARPYRYI